jgi:Flp pilus assembly protein TadG
MRNMGMTNLRDCINRRRGLLTDQAAVRKDAGQALVELALTLPLLVLLLIGAAELGRLAYYSVEVSNAARAGVAYGAQNHVTASNFAGMRTAAQNDAGNITLATTTATNSCACSSAYSATSACTTTFSCSGTNRIIEYVQVNTTATVSPIFHYPGVSKTYTLNGRAVMRVEQ